MSVDLPAPVRLQLSRRKGGIIPHAERSRMMER